MVEEAVPDLAANLRASLEQARASRPVTTLRNDSRMCRGCGACPDPECCTHSSDCPEVTGDD